jgi:hypothetical protein
MLFLVSILAAWFPPSTLSKGLGHDEQTWFPLFLLAYFHHEEDSNVQRSKHQAHLMDGIVIGPSPTSNVLLVYNPHNKQYYEPDSYRLDPYCLPGLPYQFIKYKIQWRFVLQHSL